jgi:hypothetical protein
MRFIVKRSIVFGRLLVISLFLANPFPARSQSLFESTIGNSTGNTDKYNFSGYLRSDIFANKNEFREKYAEGAFKLDIKGNKYGNAYAEMRYQASGNEDESNPFWLREGYVNLFFGKFDFRIGEQILVWGRADGFNPTNNLTPSDLTVFSPEEDDKRLANFVAKGVYNFYPLKLEVDWIPVYKATILPFGNVALPGGVSWNEDPTTVHKWKNSSLGIKLDLEKPSFDGSLSWFKGYHKMPGLNYASSGEGTEILVQPYKSQILGADFSTTAGSYGLRGEFAYSFPDNDTDSLFTIPCKQLEYTLGIDREWGNFSLILQYVGKYVFDFDEENSLRNSFALKINSWNHMLFSQQEKWNHSVSARPELDLFHETLTCEMLGLVNFSTEEVFLLPKATYTIADGFELCIGAQLFFGPDDTLYGLMQDKRNAGFAELKLSF